MVGQSGASTSIQPEGWHARASCVDDTRLVSWLNYGVFDYFGWLCEGSHGMTVFVLLSLRWLRLRLSAGLIGNCYNRPW